jgi:Na+-transporting NADH:ubiquinone oxidoreductase subunit C
MVEALSDKKAEGCRGMKKTDPGYILLFMFLVCIIFGAGVALVHYATQETLAKNEDLNRNQIICHAFNLSVTDQRAEAYQRAIDQNLSYDTLRTATRNFEVFRRQGVESDVGFVFVGMGFWDLIRGIVVLTPDLSKIVNIQFLEQKETPGLGARIEEPWFTDQFKGIQIDWTATPGQRVIIGVGEENALNRVDAITGATQTSIAVMNLLNNELEQFRQAYLQEKISG